MPETTPIQLKDMHTGEILKVGTYKQIKRFRNRFDKLDLKYGSIRYVVTISR